MGYLSYVKSWDAYNNSKYKRTLRLTTHALKSGDNALFYKQRANAYYSLQAYDYALTDYTNAIALQPYFADSYLWRAYTYIELHEDEMALKDLRYAARLFPHDHEILVKLGTEANYMEHYAEADRAFKQAQINDPDNPHLWYNIGRNLYFGEKKAEQALPSLQKAVDLNAENDKYWYAYGAALNSLGDCRAVNAFREQLALCKKDEYDDCEAELHVWAAEKLAELTEVKCRL
jgi:tetratricopeptide (TPR) repeat protein